jgi:sialidase-1
MLPSLQQQELFGSGRDGYHAYRIPSLITTSKGTVLAFAEGRKHGSGDSGDIDLVMRRSEDGGGTWQPMRVILDDGSNTVGNPCPVVDCDTGVIWLPLTRNLGTDTEREILDGTSSGSREVWITMSTDDGLTWSEPVNITRTTKDPRWTWYATGPGCGIQLRSGRLLIPCDHAVMESKQFHSHVIFSDDHGATWNQGGVLGDRTNECQVVEQDDGSLLINMRSYHGKNRRAVATSRDGGVTWSEVLLDEALIEPICQASLVRYDDPRAKEGSRLLFSNPASRKRERMTVRASADDGRTWPWVHLLHEGPAAYSCLAVLPDRRIGCLYERGTSAPYETITLARFGLDWVTAA